MEGDRVAMIRVNRELLLLDFESMQQDHEVRLAEGAIGEQCEGCGSDLVESAEIVAGRQAVRCTECGVKYDLTFGFMRDGYVRDDRRR